jgi:hypothetical protein
MSDEERELLMWFLEDVKETTNILKGLCKVNELGCYLYNDVIEYSRFYSIAQDGLQFNIPAYLADYQYVEEIAKYITLKFSEAIVRAIDIPEVHEHIATLTLPDNVIKKMNELISPGNFEDFKIVFTVDKKQGFNPIEIRQEIIYPEGYSGMEMEFILDYINNVTGMLTIELNSLDIDDRTMIIGRSKRIFIPAKLIHSKEDVEKIVNAVKSEIAQKVEDIKNSGILNLVIPSPSYDNTGYLEYSGTFSVFREKEISRYFTFNIHVERPRLLNNIRVTLNVKMPLIKEFDGEHRIEVPIEIDTDEGKFLVGLLISSLNQKQSVNIVIPEDVRESRIKRLIEGDLSVVEEVKTVDQKVVKQLIDGIKKQIKDALVENGIVVKNNKGRYVINKKYKLEKHKKHSNDYFSIQLNSMDILDLMKEDDKKKLVTYLVSEKIKSSI